MLMDAYRADTLHAQMGAIYGPAGAVGESKGPEPFPPSESWKANLTTPRFDASVERGESEVNSL